MSERTAHMLLEKNGITAREARMMGMAFFDAMDAAEADKAKAVEA